jgi:class III cytochrome C family protein
MRCRRADLAPITVAALAAAAAGAGLASPARAQFSPGPLSASHAALDKNTACLECHEPRRSTTAARCLACHRELAARIEAERGYHGRDRDRVRACASCHTDHGGREMILVSWPSGKRETFDHRLTGYALEGRHAGLACRSCHIAALVRAPDVRAARDLRPANTYLGLSVRCADCHGDVHRGQFDEQIARGDCASCHSVQGWKGVTVDHAQTRFPLEGRHASVACARCHYSVDESGARVAATAENAVVRFRPLAHDACIDCHTDPHENRYGSDCARCHSTAGWNAVAAGAFDHDKTRYPLRGLHRRVSCESCHAGGAFTKRIAFARCADCHEDRHGGQLAKSPSGGACDACHSLEGFAPARYGIAEHERTRFPLRGAHLAVPCAACHRATAAGAAKGDVAFRVKADACATCHEDQHAGQFARAAGGAECKRCHDVASWKIPSFDHRRTRFTLEGAHERTPCAGCHRVESIGRTRTVRYRPVETACRACHAAPPAKERRNS